MEKFISPYYKPVVVNEMGIDFSVSFSSTLMCIDPRHNEMQAITVCVLRLIDKGYSKETLAGVSVLSPHDHHDARLGMLWSLTRAIKQLFFWLTTPQARNMARRILYKINQEREMTKDD